MWTLFGRVSHFGAREFNLLTQLLCLIFLFLFDNGDWRWFLHLLFYGFFSFLVCLFCAICRSSCPELGPIRLVVCRHRILTVVCRCPLFGNNFAYFSHLHKSYKEVLYIFSFDFGFFSASLSLSFTRAIYKVQVKSIHFCYNSLLGHVATRMPKIISTFILNCF